MKKVMMIGSAHIDPVWLWQWQEGYHEVKATFRSALDRMNENPDFIFTCACADYYRWTEENDPEMFEEIRARIAEGRWVVVGGMWIQPDMNAPSGESLARQLMYSQRYFHEKFGLTATIGHNVDSFGHNGMMPQLYHKAGIDSYVWMRPSITENPDIPEGPMWWEGVDGTRIRTHRIHGAYTSRGDIPEKLDEIFELSEKIEKPVMCFYGVGNHGGGPTIKNLREIDAFMADDPRGKDICYASTVDYFRSLESEDIQLPVWSGELQHHASGCYSTHSASKKMHRMAESAMLRMEALGAMAHALTGHDVCASAVRQGWNNLMFNEFHDIMGGCSLPEAMEDATLQLSEAVSIAAREENAALQRMSWKVDTMKGHPLRVRSKEEDKYLWGVNGQGTPVIIFNPHPFEAEGIARVHRSVQTVRDDAGNVIPCQTIRATRTNRDDRWDGIFRAKIPAMGYRLFWFFQGEKEEPETSELSVSQRHIENANIRAEFDPMTGALTSLINKQTGEDALSGPARAKLVDIEHCDTWAHNVFKFDRPAGAFSDAGITVLENGPVRAVLRVVTRFGISTLEQRYVLYAGADQLEVEVKLDMHEKFRMLKLCFPTPYGKEYSEIPYGVITRQANGNEEHCQRWIAMQGETCGLSILNNGKYSYSAAEGELRLTVSNTSLFADHYGQDYRDDTCEFMDMGVQRFSYALVPYNGSWQDAALHHRAAVFNQPLPFVVETYHEGPLKSEFTGIRIDNTALSAGAFKRSENGNGYILRIAEATGRSQKASVDFTLLNRSFDLAFAPFEIKTVLIPDDPSEAVREVPLTEIEK